MAKEIGVSPATLSRIERGNLPDLSTFSKVCKWLGIDPGEILGVSKSGDRAEAEKGPIAVAAHFRAGQTPSPELARALADMIITAQRMTEAK